MNVMLYKHGPRIIYSLRKTANGVGGDTKRSAGVRIPEYLYGVYKHVMQSKKKKRIHKEDDNDYDQRMSARGATSSNN